MYQHSSTPARGSMTSNKNCNAKHKKVSQKVLEILKESDIDSDKTTFIQKTRLDKLLPIFHNPAQIFVFKDDLGVFWINKDSEFVCSECYERNNIFYKVESEEVGFEPKEPFEILCRTCFDRKTNHIELFEMVKGLG